MVLGSERSSYNW